MVRLPGKWPGPTTILTLVALASFSTPLRGADWKPISPQEMALKDDPMNPGSAAIILYYEDYTSDQIHLHREYHRIKILKEEGTKYANVTIPFIKPFFNIGGLEARTIRPDGRIVEFNGEVYEKPDLKIRRFGSMVKTFTLPGVQVGSIIEYKFNRYTDPAWSGIAFFRSNLVWTLQRDLSILEAHFTLIPVASLRWVSFGLPRGYEVVQLGDTSIQFHIQKMASLPVEELTYPSISLRSRVVFFYVPDRLNIYESRSPDGFWKALGEYYFDSDKSFTGKRKEIQEMAREVVNSEASPEARLRRLYARAQAIRNLSYERVRTEKERKNDGIEENAHAGEVLTRGYGYDSEINKLFAALARGAGFEASIVYLTSRDEAFFEREVFSEWQLDTTIVRVRLGTTEWLLDPGSKFCPFEILPWEKTAAEGVLPAHKGFSYFKTPVPSSQESMSERRAKLRLDLEGSLEGTATIVLSGQEAYQWRYEHRENDEVGYRKAMEDDIKETLPAGATVEIANQPAWKSSDDKLSVEIKVKLPGYASASGRRWLLLPGVFQARGKYPFPTIRRVHPIMLPFPFQRLDEVRVELSPGIQVESLPAARKKEYPSLQFEISRTSEGQTVRMVRKVLVNSHSFPTTAYSSLRVFYDNVRAGDEEQIVLKAAESTQHE